MLVHVPLRVYMRVFVPYVHLCTSDCVVFSSFIITNKGSIDFMFCFFKFICNCVVF